MIECNFCHSASQDNYVYAECTHLVCLLCASLKWDRKYSFKCCNTTTFLEEDTCLALQKLNHLDDRPRKDESKENIPAPPAHEKSQPTAPRKEDHPLKSREIQQSVYVSQFEQRPVEKQQQAFNDRKNDVYLAQMEEVMNESVQRIKFSFEMYRKEVERREENLLKEVYSKFSDQFAKYTVTEEDTREFREKVNRMIADELNNLTKIALREPDGKPDKILEKLEYNQIKMKEKLNRHYELLK